MAAFRAVLDDDDLLRVICSVSDAAFLSTARSVSGRLRAFATTEIHTRLPHCELPEGVASFKARYDGVHKFLQTKCAELTVTVADNKMPSEIVGDLDEALVNVREKHVRLYESGLVPAMLCEPCSVARMQQAVVWIALLRDQQVTGPHVIVTPGPAEWQAVFEMIAPSIPLIVNEGTPNERWNKLATQSQLGQGPASNFVWISSYSLAVKDMANLNKFLKVSRSSVRFTIFDQGDVELRRGWKKNSPTWKLYHLMVLNGRPAVPSGFILSGRAFTEFKYSDVEWALDAICENMFDGELKVSSFYGTLRQFGVGKRDAPHFIEPLLSSLRRSMIEVNPRFQCQTIQRAAASATSSGGQ